MNVMFVVAAQQGRVKSIAIQYSGDASRYVYGHHEGYEGNVQCEVKLKYRFKVYIGLKNTMCKRRPI